MPRIINAYADGSSSVADSLAKLGESIFGDQAKNEVYRQKAFSGKRENDNIPLLADAVARGDRDAIARYGVMSNKGGQDTSEFNRLGVSNHATGVDDPRLAIATMGAGGAFTSTAPGQGRALANDRFTNAATNAAGERNNVRTNAETHYSTDRDYDKSIRTTGMNNDTSLRVGEGNNRASVTVGEGNNAASRDVAQIQADKQAASDKYKFDNTYENTYDPESGRTVLTPRSQAAAREIAPTKDSVVGGMLRRVGDAQQAGAPGAAGIDANNPFASLSPQVQHVAGVAVPEQSLIEPRSGMTGISRDGGQTIILPNGARIPATGFQPVGQDAALTQASDNKVRAGAANPLVVGDPAKSKAAADARATSGLGPALKTELNHTIGAIPGAPAVLQGAFGTQEVGPGTQRARSDQDIRNNQARAVLLGGPGRQTVQAQKWVNELIPQGDAFSNPATEEAKIPTIVNALKGDHEQIRQLVIDPNTLPAERVKLAQQLHQIENTIRMYTDTAPAAAAPVAPAGAPAVPISGPQTAAPAGPPPGAVQMLRQQPGLAAAFDAKYGAGASAQVLGAQ